MLSEDNYEEFKIKGILSKKNPLETAHYMEISPVDFCNLNCYQCHQPHHLKMEKDKKTETKPQKLSFDRLKSLVQGEKAEQAAKRDILHLLAIFGVL